MTAKAKRRAPGEGGVYPYQTTKGERWFFKCTVTLPNGDKKVVVRRGFELKSAAIKELRKALSSGDAGTFADPGKVTVEQWLRAWLDAVQVSESSLGRYRQHLERSVIPALGAVPLKKLTAARIRALYQELARTGGRWGHGLAPSTVGKVHAVLHQALGAAVDAEPPLLARNPASKASPPDAPDDGSRIKAWTPRQLAAFLAWADEHDPERAPLWRFIAATGTRRGEALGVQWSDLGKREVAILRGVRPGQRGEPVVGPVKTRRGRAVSLDDEAVAELKAWRVRRAAVSLALVRAAAPIFGTEDGDRLTPAAVTTAFRVAVRRSREDLGTDALPTITLHGLRHTSITHWLMVGEAVTTVAERHGLSVMVMLKTYAHVLAGAQGAAAERVAAALRAEATRSA